MKRIPGLKPHFLLFLVMQVPAWACAGETEVIDRDDPEIVLAYKGEAVVTQEALDAAFARIPEEHRLAFIRDGAKVDRLVQNLLQAQLVALDAKAAGFDADPQVQLRVSQVATKELSEAWIQALGRKAPEADLAAMAYEDYLANPDSYRSSLSVDVTHVLIGKEHRTDAEAKALAQELRARVDADPALFDSLVAEYSDDPTKGANAGKIERVGRGQTVKPFEEAAFDLKVPGGIAGPVQTEYGYHLVRLDARHESELPPYEQVKERAEARMKAKHEGEFRERYLKALFAEPTKIPPGAVDIMLRRHFGENLEDAPVFTEDGIE